MEIPEIREAIGVTEEWQERARKRMHRHDSMSPALRELANEFGGTLINDFLNCGVSNPRHIRHLVMRVLEGASSQNANGGPSLIRARAADLGMVVSGTPPHVRAEARAAFLKYADAETL